MLTVADVISALTGQHPSGPTQVIADVVVDIQQATPGAALFLLPGQGVVDAQQLAQALERGVVLIIGAEPAPKGVAAMNLRTVKLASLSGGPLYLQVDDVLDALQRVARYWRWKFSTRFICITGSVGKTTTKDLSAEVLGSRYRTLKNSGRPDSQVEIPLAMMALSEAHQRVILEIQPDVLGKNPTLDELARPDVAVITNISTAHAAKSGPQAAIEAKVAWLGLLPSDGCAILNYDDPWVRAMAPRVSAQVLTYGLDSRADLWADEVEGLGLEGIYFRVHYHKESVYLRVPLIGRYAVHTALRAAAVGLVEGLTWQEIVAGLRYGNLQLRLVVARTPAGAIILDDTYSITPESMLAALNLLGEMEGRKIAVLAGAPDLDLYVRQGLEMVGLRAAQIADQLVTVGETGQWIAAAARSAWMSGYAIHEMADVREAVGFLREFLQAGDVVLVKGPQGLHMDQIATELEGVR